ncbi:MAG: hypothetical protein IPH44_42025 [Myxococcales bacterium]|nr:hypothetical protein [Myxococcales bacterium]MBK7193025.1 hypothetical protein [Myxococcales bacterium]MBP6843082.1 hypothetical protein [Kofleriaceae bacterium]
MPVYEYREIPSTGGEVGGDEIYLGESFEIPGELLPFAEDMPTDGETGAPDGKNATPVYVHPTTGAKYDFVAWNVTSADPAYAAYDINDLRVAFTGPSVKTPVTATAWYVKQGGGDGRPAVMAFGLDRAVNRFFRRTPIASVVSAASTAWAGGEDRIVHTGDAASDVTAVGQLNGYMLVNKLLLQVEFISDFTVWRMRKHPVAGGALGLAQGESGVAIAVYEQGLRGKRINAVDPDWMRLVRGKLSLAEIRRLITTPVSDTGGAFGGPQLTMQLAQLGREELGRLRDHLRNQQELTAAALDVTERVLRG